MPVRPVTPSGRVAAKGNDEITPSDHSITSSASASSLSGTVSPSRLGGRQVDDEVELRGLHNWQIARLFALQYSTGIAPRQAVCICDATAVGHEPTGKGKLPPFIDCWYGMARRKRNQLLASTIEKRITCDQQRRRPPLD